MFWFSFSQIQTCSFSIMAGVLCKEYAQGAEPVPTISTPVPCLTLNPTWFHCRESEAAASAAAFGLAVGLVFGSCPAAVQHV